MNSVITVSFRYTQRDVVKAMHAHFADRLRLKLDIPLIILLAAAGIYLVRLPERMWWGATFLCFSAMFTLVLMTAFGVVPYAVLRQEPRYRDDHVMTFSADSIHFHTAHVDSKLQWSLYTRALVIPDAYILYYGTRSFTLVPKRVFSTPEQQKEFEQLLAEKIPRIIRKDQ